MKFSSGRPRDLYSCSLPIGNSRTSETVKRNSREKTKRRKREELVRGRGALGEMLQKLNYVSREKFESRRGKKTERVCQILRWQRRLSPCPAASQGRLMYFILFAMHALVLAFPRMQKFMVLWGREGGEYLGLVLDWAKVETW